MLTNGQQNSVVKFFLIRQSASAIIAPSLVLNPVLVSWFTGFSGFLTVFHQKK